MPPCRLVARQSDRAEKPQYRRSVPARDGALPIKLHRAQARSYRFTRSGPASPPAQIPAHTPNDCPPSISICPSSRGRCRWRNCLSAVRRSVPARDGALPIEPHRAQARSYRFTHSGSASPPAQIIAHTPNDCPPSISTRPSSRGRCRGRNGLPAVRRSVPARDGALPIKLHRAQARSYRFTRSGSASAPAQIPAHTPNDCPPSTASTCPVIQRACGDARNNAASAMCCTCPNPPNGMLSRMRAYSSGS